MIPHLLTRKRKFSEEARSIPKKLKTVLCSESETSEQVSVPLVTGVSSNRREQALDCVLPNVVEIASDEKQRSACSTFDIVEHCNNVEKSGSFSSSNFMKGTLIDGSKARIIKEKIELSILANESKDIGKILAHTDPSIEVNSTTDLSTTRLDHDRSQKNCYCDESKQEVDRLLPRCYAPTLKEFLLPSGVEKYLPRPEWYSFPLKQVSKLAGQFATEKEHRRNLSQKIAVVKGKILSQWFLIKKMRTWLIVVIRHLNLDDTRIRLFMLQYGVMLLMRWCVCLSTVVTNRFLIYVMEMVKHH